MLLNADVLESCCLHAILPNGWALKKGTGYFSLCFLEPFEAFCGVLPARFFGGVSGLQAINMGLGLAIVCTQVALPA